MLGSVSDVVLHHHERYDGHGYPEGLEGEAISLPARIVCVADAYCAMISKRSYKESATEAEARGVAPLQGHALRPGGGGRLSGRARRTGGRGRTAGAVRAAAGRGRRRRLPPAVAQAGAEQGLSRCREEWGERGV